MFPDFEDDGCTLFFDKWKGIDLRQCCDVHDQAFAYGTTFDQWVDANLALVQCGIDHGALGWAVLAFFGLFIGSAPFFFLGRKKSGDPT